MEESGQEIDVIVFYDINVILELIDASFDGMNEVVIEAAHLARQAGSSDDTVIAALLHDIGQFLPENLVRQQIEELKSNSEDQSVGRMGHETIGEQYLQSLGFGSRVRRLVGSHVAAKRYLTAIDPNYYGGLSSASKKSLEFQSGPFVGMSLNRRIL
ncbi:MAG: hypothetical protein MMC33_006900 [Icmadophila ericetorum]|nr:hypothetical protein [Icmadophila ericetorum]